MSLLYFQNISKAFRNKVVLNDISLAIERRERVALIGENGSGKSTLLKIAMGILPSDSGRMIQSRGVKIGYLSQNSDDLIGGAQNALYLEDYHKMYLELKAFEHQMGKPKISTDPEALERVLKSYARCLEAYEHADGYTIESKVKKTLLGLGMHEDALYAPLEQLSGGEKIRVALARILIEEPDLLILDEPTNHLDLPSIEWLEDYLLRFEGGVLLVSHDRYFLDRVTTRTAELHHGNLVIKKCNYSAFIAQKEIIDAFTQKAIKNQRITIRDQKSQIEALKRHGKIKQANSRLHDLEKMQDNLAHLQSYKRSENLKRGQSTFAIKAHGHVSKDVAWAKHCTKAFGNRVLFEDITFHIAGGDHVGIIGPNGSGKTTLLKMLMREENAYEGELTLGNWITYAYLGQNVTFEDETRTIIEEIQVQTGYETPEALKYLAKFKFYGDTVNTSLNRLSGGERIRIYLSELLLRHPHCLILDEPTNHLDLESREAIEEAVNQFIGTVIAVSHDRHYLTHCTTKILALAEQGLIQVNGNYEAYKRFISNQKSKSNDEVNTRATAPKSSKNTPTPVAKVSETALFLSKEAIEAEIIKAETELMTLEINIMAEPNDNEGYYAMADLQAQIESLYVKLQRVEDESRKNDVVQNERH